MNLYALLKRNKHNWLKQRIVKRQSTHTQHFRNFKSVVENPERIKVAKHERVEIFTFYETAV